MDQLIGRVLHDRYCIQSLLGRKTGRRTFLASDLQTHSAVVVKLLLFGPDFVWDDLKLFEREAETLKTLSHPSIPQYLDSFEVDTELGKGFALVQSYIEARSLQDWIQAGRNFSENDLKAIAKELLEILDYLHTRQPPVVHRDIKPSNILLGGGEASANHSRSGNSPGKVCLVDFGSVRTASHDGTMTVVGTYGYMPPEQFGGRTTPASDLYSLGATLIYLLVGTHPADLPTHNGRIQFENEHIASESFQTWLRYLIQPDVSQRFKNARSALEALQNEQFRPTFEPLRLKPNGSRVILNKTDTQLKITIPSLSIRQKLRVIYSALWLTAFACSLLLVSLWKLEAGLLVAPLVLYMVASIWVSNIYKIFAKTHVLIDQSEICLTLDWLGLKRRYSSSTKNILRLERLNYKFNNQNASSPIVSQYSGLYIWVGNKRYSLGAFDPTSGEASRLTEVELDWLAVELSDWLDLPIQTLAEAPTLNSQINSQSRGSANTGSTDKDSRNTSLISTPPSNELSKISRPKNAVCTIKKSAETLEISAPAEHGLGFQVLAFVLFVVFFIFMVGAGINSLVALLLGTVPVVSWGISDRMNSRSRTTEIILQINSQDISLWEQSHQSGQQQCLERVSCSKIHKLQLVYKNEKGGQRCHVKVCTNYSSNNSEDGFLVGNQSFWLSRIEAEWLAHELSAWLKLPITEVEVIDNSAM